MGQNRLSNVKHFAKSPLFSPAILATATSLMLGAILIRVKKRQLTMGYASYLEDINTRFVRLEKTIEDHNKSSEKRIDIGAYFDLRKEIRLFIEKARPYLERNIDIIENGELEKINNVLRDEIRQLKYRNDELVNEKSQINGSLNETKSQLAKATEVLATLRKQLHEESSLRVGRTKLEKDYSDLLLEFSSQFRYMKDITASTGWSKNKECVRTLESLIDKGLQRT